MGFYTLCIFLVTVPFLIGKISKVIGTDFDDHYVAKLKEQSIHPEIIKDAAKDMKIVYTPLHGTGNVPVRRVLRELG